jgi:hypothetical protein
MEDYRSIDFIKHTKLIIFGILCDKEEGEAKELVIAFMREYVKKSNIKNKIIYYT